MDLLLLLSYAAICTVIFKVFKIPLNKWSVPTAALGGIVLVGSLVLLMNYNHPHSIGAVQTYYTTPVIPNVKGRVIEVIAEANTPLKKGDILFKIDPKPFQLIVDEKKAALEAALAQIKQLEKAVELEESLVVQAKANRDRTLQSYERYLEASKSGGTSEVSVENKRQFYLSSEAVLVATYVGLNASKLELENHRINTVTERRAELAQAEFDLDSTVVRAPTDGYATQLILRPGMMATPLPLRPVMVFVHTDPKSIIVASFRQNAMQRLQAGYEAEVMYPGIPGRVFKAKISRTVPSLAEGAVQATGNLIKAKEMTQRGLVPVLVEVDDDLEGYVVRDGAFAEVAVYSDKMHHVAIMRKILFRMKSWQNYLYLDH